ncbi:MAG: hypothetical protein Kow00124_24160 [Anaerolineae bacterium]
MQKPVGEWDFEEDLPGDLPGGPLGALLRSRKVLVALVTLIVDVIVVLVPELEAAQGELLTVFTLIGSLLVASIAYEDGQAKRGGAARS